MAKPKILFVNEEIALRRSMKANAAKNPSGVKSESPRPAQVEGLATPLESPLESFQGADLRQLKTDPQGYRTLHFNYSGEDIDGEGVAWSIPVAPLAFITNSDQQRAALIVRAVNSFDALVEAAQALLDRVDNITSDEFSKGGERAEREALRKVLEGIATKGNTQTT